MAYIDDVAREVHMKYYNRGFFNKEKEEIREVCEITRASERDAKAAIKRVKEPIAREDKKRARQHQRYIRRMQSNIDRSYMNAHPEEREAPPVEEPLARDNVAKCPKCRSTSISYDTKKLSVGRGIVGGLVGGAIGGAQGESAGIILGGLSSKKGYAVCLNCGKKWKI